MAKLDNVLRETLIEVESKLRDDLDIERKKAKENYFKTVPELSKKQERLKKIEEKQEALRKEYREIENDIKNLDPNISVDVIHELNKQENLELNCYSSKQSDVATARAIKDTKADINIKAFNKIKTQIKNQFNLAITPKQKQQVILGLQTSVNWKDLGINVPNMFEVNKVEVKDGTIIIDNALPDLK